RRQSGRVQATSIALDAQVSISSGGAFQEARVVEPSLNELLDALLSGGIAATDLPIAQQRAIIRWCGERSKASAATIDRLLHLGHVRTARRARLEHLGRREVILYSLFCAARRRWPVKRNMSPRQAAEHQRQRFVSCFAEFPNAARLTRPARARVRHM